MVFELLKNVFLFAFTLNRHTRKATKIFKNSEEHTNTIKSNHEEIYILLLVFFCVFFATPALVKLFKKCFLLFFYGFQWSFIIFQLFLSVLIVFQIIF